MNQPSKTVSIKYDKNSKLLYGDVDGTQTLFSSPAQVPDYSKRIVIAGEARYFPQAIAEGSWLGSGKYCSQYEHYYCRNASDTMWDLNESLSYIAPDNGFIGCEAIIKYYTNRPNVSYSLDVYLLRKDLGYTILFTFGASEININNVLCFNVANNVMVPVRKGDKIYYGTRFPYQTIPQYYGIYFYPYYVE